MKKSKKRMMIEYRNCRRETAWVTGEESVLFKELNSSTDYFRILESLAFEIELKLNFLKVNGHKIDLWMLEGTSEIYDAITTFRSYRIDVLNVKKDSRPFHLFSNAAYNSLTLSLYISENHLYEKFFYFRFFKTKYFLN